MTTPRLCPPSPRKVLAGGRAPVCWKRQVRRATAGPAVLARACAWVADLAHQPGPKLRREPLLGHCLPELVGDLGQEEPPPPAETEPRRGKPPAPREGTGDGTKSGHGPSTDARRPRRMRGDLPAGRKPDHRPAAASVAGKPRRATPELLARLGGPAAKSRPATSNRRPPTDGGRQTTDDRRPTADRIGHNWSDRLIERVKRRTLPSSPRQGLGEGSASRLAALVSSEERPADLAAQWGGSLEGRRVPAGWLAARLGQAGRGSVVGADGRGGRGAEPSPGPSPNPSRREGSGGPMAPVGSPTAAGRRGPGWHSRLRPRRAADGTLWRGGRTASDAGRGSFASEDANSEGWAGPDEGGATRRDGRLEADDGQVVSVVSRFAPPQMADTLPPLRPPAGPGITAMPAAAAASRRSARREEETAVDDLDELAGKLRRILEEESRRHGIDI